MNTPLDKVAARPSEVNPAKIRKYIVETNSSTNLNLPGPQNRDNPKAGSIDSPITLKSNSRKNNKAVS